MDARDTDPFEGKAISLVQTNILAIYRSREEPGETLRGVGRHFKATLPNPRTQEGSYCRWLAAVLAIHPFYTCGSSSFQCPSPSCVHNADDAFFNIVQIHGYAISDRNRKQNACGPCYQTIAYEVGHVRIHHMDIARVNLTNSDYVLLAYLRGRAESCEVSLDRVRVITHMLSEIKCIIGRVADPADASGEKTPDRRPVTIL